MKRMKLMVGIGLFFILLSVGVLIVNNQNDSAEPATIPQTTPELVSFSDYLTNLSGTEIPDTVAQSYLFELGIEETMRVLTTVRPHCHTEAHAIGRTFFNTTKDLGNAIMQCGRQCTDGCFHGIVMGLFAASTTHTHAPGEPEHDPHPVLTAENAPEITTKFVNLCDDPAIVTATNGRRGDCMHAVGHAALFLTGYDTPPALELCKLFKEPGEQYFCATGVYMERNFSDVTNADDNAQGLFYPCAEETTFPAACYRYELQEINDKKLLSQEDVLTYCLERPTASQQRGCLHGYGFAYHYTVQTNLPSITTLCQYGDTAAQELCVEGAIGAAGNQIPDTIAEACTYLPNNLKAACMTGVVEHSFGMNRDFSRYVNEL